MLLPRSDLKKRAGGKVLFIKHRDSQATVKILRDQLPFGIFIEEVGDPKAALKGTTEDICEILRLFR